MQLNSKELVKLMLTREGITQKELSVLITEKTNKKVTPDGLSRKLSRGTITYNEVAKIADILGYDINIERRQVL